VAWADLKVGPYIILVKVGPYIILVKVGPLHHSGEGRPLRSVLRQCSRLTREQYNLRP